MQLLKLEQKKVSNTRGKVFYGIHMYPGISENTLPDGETERLYVSDATIRKMGPSMQGCPVYCFHKTPTGSIDDVREESEGWVESSFFNEPDGLHWVKFIATSSKSIAQCESKRFGLSNGYDILAENPSGGARNGVEYDSEVTDGKFHHLAIVPNPRYESMILTPEEFKQYNAGKRDETRRVANSKDGYKGKTMTKKAGSKISFFSRKKVENSRDLENHSVLLPKSGQEKTIAEIVKLADKQIFNAGKPRVCNADDVVRVEEDGEEKEMSIADLVERLSELEERLEALESGDDDMDEDEEVDEIDNDDDMDDDEEVDNDDDDDDMEVDNAEDDDNDEDETPKKKMKKKAEAKAAVKNKDKGKTKGVKNSSGSVFRIGKQAPPKKGVTNSKDKKAKKRADAAREAPRRVANAGEVFAVDTVEAKVERGLQRYGKR